jgi:protein TonB
VLALGRREVRTGMAIGLAGALLVHGAGAGSAARQLPAMASYAGDVRAFVIESLLSQYDVEMIKPPPPPPPVEEKRAAEEEAQKPARAPDPSPTQPQEQPPEPAQAGRVLTADPDPDEPIDFSGDGFVTGNADHFTGGATSRSGTSTTPVYDQGAKPGGTPGGKGTGPAQTAAAPTTPPADLSRPAMPTSRGGNWSCPFPAQADVDQVDYALVTIVVTVGPDGRARSAVVSRDPGHGFGPAAQRCAMQQRYEPGLDSSGKPVTRTTPPFTVRFTR